jgi:shikimate kinase
MALWKIKKCNNDKMTSNDKMTIFLLGPMGSGKSWCGERLAERLNVTFIDMDRQIEQGEEATIAEIFERSGEAGFRKLEHVYLRRLDGISAAVVATGGGTPCFFDNMEWMNARGITVYLKTPLDILLTRLLPAPNMRPLLQGLYDQDLETWLEKMLEEREPFYRKAHITLHQSGETDFLSLLEKKIRENW